MQATTHGKNIYVKKEHIWQLVEFKERQFYEKRT